MAGKNSDVMTEIVLLLALAVSVTMAYPQSITVKGQCMCGNNSTSSKDTWVKILNKSKYLSKYFRPLMIGLDPEKGLEWDTTDVRSMMASNF